MSIFEFLPLMKGINSTVTTISVAVVAVFLLLMIFRLLGGMSRGFYRQLMRLGFNIGALVIAFIVVSSSADNIIRPLNLDTVLSLIPTDVLGEEAGGKVTEMLSSFPTDAVEQILLLPAAIIVLPIAFMVVYFIAKAVLGIIRAILTKIFKIKKAQTNSQRLGGAVLSAIEGIIFFIVIFLPFTSVINILDKTYEDALTDEDSSISTELVEDYKENIVPITKNPAISFVGNMGSKAIASSFATVEIDGVKSHVDEDIVPILRLLLIDTKGDGKIEWNNLTEENKSALTRLLDCVGDSDYLSNLFVSVIKASTGLLKNGLLGGGGEIPEEGVEKADEFLDSLMAFLESFNKETLKEDLVTLRDLYFELSDSGVMVALKEQDGDLVTIITSKNDEGGNVISNIKTILQANPRTTPIVTMLTKLLLSGMVSEGDGAEISYEELKTDMNKVLEVKKENYADEEDYKNALSGTLDSTLREHGITLEEEIVDEIADYVDDNFSEISELTDEEFNDIILQYYDIYLDYIESEK